MIRHHPTIATTISGQRSYLAGQAAEQQVEQLYEQMGARCVARRWRGTLGELDLVFEQDGGVTVVEVKASKTHDEALTHLNPNQIKRIWATAEELLESCPRGSLTPLRIDVATVDAFGHIQIIENALMG